MCDSSLSSSQKLLPIMSQIEVNGYRWYCIPDFCETAAVEYFGVSRDRDNIFYLFNRTLDTGVNIELSCASILKNWGVRGHELENIAKA